MLNDLMNSGLCYWLGGFGLFAVLCALQGVMSYLYLKKWNVYFAACVSVVLGVVLTAFIGWLVLFMSPASVAVGTYLAWWITLSVIALLMYFLPLCLLSFFKVGWLGYYTALFVMASLTVPGLLLGYLGGNGGAGQKIGAIVFGIVYACAYAFGMVCAYNYKGANVTVIKHFHIEDSLSKGTGEKVKVVLVNGQSNASGVSRISYLKQKVSDADFERYTSGYDNVYINYFNDNASNTSGGAFVHLSAGAGYIGDKTMFGPELSLGDKLAAKFPDEKVFIIKYAWGGSDLHTQWLSPSSDGKTGELYTAFVNFTTCCLEYLKRKNYDPEIYAMCWMQGESDSIYHKIADPYGERSLNLIRDVRAQFADYASANGITFVDAGISDSKYWPLYKEINELKKANVDRDDKYVFIDTIAAGVEYRNEPTEEIDFAHYDSVGMIKLGELFADAVIKTMK